LSYGKGQVFNQILPAPHKKKEKRRLMCPDRLSFLTKFDKFYQELINLTKEDKINEPEFYMILIAKAKAMDRERMDQKKNLKVDFK
jgi:hypothetical protein